MAAKSSSLLCFTSVSVATPMAPRTALPTKLALAEKHTKPSGWLHTHHNVRLDGGFGEISFVAAAVTVGVSPISGAMTDVCRASPAEEIISGILAFRSKRHLFPRPYEYFDRRTPDQF